MKTLTYRDCRRVLPLFGLYLVFLTASLIYIGDPDLDLTSIVVWSVIFIIFISNLIIFPLLLTSSSKTNFPTTFSRAVGSRSFRYIIPLRDLRNKAITVISSYLLGTGYGPEERDIIRENSESLVGTAISVILIIRLIDISGVSQPLSNEMQAQLPTDVATQIISNFTIDYGAIVSALGAILLARGSLLGSISNFRQNTDTKQRELKGTIYEFWGFVMLFAGYSFIIVESLHILINFYISDFWIWSGAATIFSFTFSTELVLNLLIWILGGIVVFFSSLLFFLFGVSLLGESVLSLIIAAILLALFLLNLVFIAYVTSWYRGLN